MYKILENNLNNFDKNHSVGNSKYLIQMYSQAKTNGTNLPEVHGVQKGLDPHLRPEKQHTILKKGKLVETMTRSRKSRIKEVET